MTRLFSLLAGVALAALFSLAPTLPAHAGLLDFVPGPGVGHFSGVDHPDVPNCTVIDPVPGCETVPEFRSGFVGTSGTVSCAPWEVWGGEAAGCVCVKP